MIEKTKSIANNDSNVSAVLMYGSFTKNEGDQYSDIEFYIFMKSLDNVHTENWISQIHPLALYFTNEYGSEVAIFDNMVRGEFHFLTTRGMSVINSWDGLVAFSDFNKMMLVDKEGLLATTLSQIKTPTPDRTAPANRLWLGQSLLNVLLTTSNLIKRQEFAHAYQSLASVQKYLLWLIRIETSQTSHWESPTKCLEKDIDKRWYAEFHQTTCELNPDKITAAFVKSTEIAAQLFDSLDLPPKLKNTLMRIR